MKTRRTVASAPDLHSSFSFQVSDLEPGPILAPDHGFFVRSTARRESALRPAMSATPPDSALQTLGEKFNSHFS